VHTLSQNGFGGQAIGRALVFGGEIGLHANFIGRGRDGHD
jgi:hypothetical protein